MSWSVTATGKAGAVRESIKTQFAAAGKCSEPEEGVRLAAAMLIDTAIAAQDQAGTAVRVNASGSMGYANYSEKTGLYNSLSITVEVLHGFVTG